MKHQLRTSYDDVPYKTHPIAQSHPARLATVASLFGVKPASVDRCRVLEIGCAGGENLLPLADNFPSSEFVGIDLSTVQISSAQNRVVDLGLRNVQFLHVDLCVLPEELGEFDYILAHGVYSWVSHDVQNALLAVCHRHLAPQGIAYVSYNTYPGWHMRGMIRDMMNYRVRNLVTPGEQIQQARALLHFLAESVNCENNAYGILLNNELQSLSRHYDSYLFHEHLEKENNPVYFHEFAESASAAGLQYIGEADFTSMFVDAFPKPVQAMLRDIALTLVEAEQYMDFVRNRTFRQTLLCRDSIALDRSLRPERIEPMSVASPTRPESIPVNLGSREQSNFRHGSCTATTSDPLTKSALLCLGDRWPEYMEFRELFDVACQRLASESALLETTISDQSVAQLAQSLLGCYANGLVDLSISPPQFATVVIERPLASRLARYQASTQAWATNLLHRDVRLQEHERHLLYKLDGKHDFTSLVKHLVSLINKGALSLTDENEAIDDAQDIQRATEQATRTALARFGKCGLLAS